MEFRNNCCNFVPSNNKNNTTMIKFTKKEMNEIVSITCYGRTERMTRRAGLEKYSEGASVCDGSEAERYSNIVMQLLDGETECYDL